MTEEQADLQKLKKQIEIVLKNDDLLWDEEGNLNQIRLIELAAKHDETIINLLYSDESLRQKFFLKVKNAFIFKTNAFQFFMEENKVDNSFTAYKNRIGLTDGKKFIKDTNDIVLNFPYKDCVLEGGQSSGEDSYAYFESQSGKYEKVEGKRKEIFYNETIAHDEIDRLLDTKAFINWKRYNKSGEHEVEKIQRHADGTISENMVIKGNNLLALHSLKEQFAGKIKLIYIDPPYNTKGTANTFCYNNCFKESTWLTFMKNRLQIAKELLREDGFIAIAIDHHELFYLGVLVDEIFGRENRMAVITVVHQARGRNMEKNFSASNEFMLVYSREPKTNIRNTVLDECKKAEFNMEDEKSKYYLKEYIVVQGGAGGVTRYDKPAYWYPVYVSPNLKEITLYKKEGYEELYPITDNGKELTWLTIPKTLEARVKEGEVIAEKIKEKTKLYRKFREQQITTTHWVGSRYNATSHGTLRIEKILGSKEFSYAKSINTLIDTIKLMTEEDDIILDFFAGSGTTGHATLEVNKEDGGNRRFILIEQMDYIERITRTLLGNVIKSDGFGNFIYCELAKWNEQAKEEIQACKDLKQLKALLSELCNKYFLHYNVKIKEFKEKIIKEEKFCSLPLARQKEIFSAMLDNNQLYVHYSEMEDTRFNISTSDQSLTKEFYEDG